ncbi:hypothetical protein QR680_004002 [Steinernema hermaphroditum]|uniref:Lipase n=1 Tax=Steinernema hermaphroditum TaxID=289476 RepID=A0AA39LT98_9BILA|nr:hypothetical protein QR680_004002 [Steinernema hermaphroditum]
MLLGILLSLLVFQTHAADDPEVKMDTIEIIKRWGYPAERVDVTTADGYVLELHHIPHGRNATKARKRPVIFLQHGLECDSSNWIVNLPHQSAGFVFADAGFDVWMGNVRGNTYGRKSLKTMEKNFWDFSFDEHIRYDLPAMIDAVLKRTRQDSLYYVGHSQGTLIMFAKLSQDPQFAKKIKKFFALAPVNTINYITGFGDMIISAINKKVFRTLLSKFDLEIDLPDFVKPWTGILCGNWMISSLCAKSMHWLAGPNTDQLNRTRLPVIVSHGTAGTSLKNMRHWGQLKKSGKLQMFDYGDENFSKYKMATPPFYDISKVNVDTYLYWGDMDNLADKQDIRESILPWISRHILKGNTEFPDFNHMDFIWGSRATEKIYKPIVDIVNDDVRKH